MLEAIKRLAAAVLDKLLLPQLPSTQPRVHPKIVPFQPISMIDLVADGEALERTIFESMAHICATVRPTHKGDGCRKYPIDYIRIAEIDWEIRKRIPDLETLKEERRRNLIAVALRELVRDCRIERIRCGKRREEPRFRTLPVLDSLAKAAP